jgi:hypothetical protein
MLPSRHKLHRLSTPGTTRSDNPDSISWMIYSASGAIRDADSATEGMSSIEPVKTPVHQMQSSAGCPAASKSSIPTAAQPGIKDKTLLF